MRSTSHDAVSPVIGVMLMLVVVIIIAAVVAGFSGGMIGGAEKPPNLIMDVKIINTGYYSTSGFFASVIEVNRPILTKDLKIVTSWTITNRITGNRKTGGSTVMPNVGNINHHICNPFMWGYPTGVVSPFGGGPSIVFSNDYKTEMYNNGRVGSQYWWGQYTLVPGMTLSAPAQHASCRNYWEPTDSDGMLVENGVYGAAQLYKYPDPSFIDGVTAVLGPGWEDLRAGDTVNVKVFYIPTNMPIFNKNVLVTEG